MSKVSTQNGSKMNELRNFAKLLGVKPRSSEYLSVVMDAIKQQTRGDLYELIHKNEIIFSIVNEELLLLKNDLSNFIHVSFDNYPIIEEVEDFWDGIYSYTIVSQFLDIFDASIFSELSILLLADVRMKKMFILAHRNLSDVENEFLSKYIVSLRKSGISPTIPRSKFK